MELVLCHWNARGLVTKDPLVKKRLGDLGAAFCGVSESHTYRGVAQGAVESPFFYACFINGLADELKQKGLGIRIAGVLTPLLMYDDDVVLQAGSIVELRAMNDVVTDYARRNRYTLNGQHRQGDRGRGGLGAVDTFGRECEGKKTVQVPWR